VLRWTTLIDGLAAVNIAALQIAWGRRDYFLSYLSVCIQQRDEWLRRGLPRRDPVAHLRQTLSAGAKPETFCLPCELHDDGGGTRLEELVYLAAATRVLQPRKIFEIGTFKGRTAAVFALNAPNAEIVTLDLPPDYSPDTSAYISTDAELVKTRRPAEFIDRYAVGAQCRQVLCDSKNFDPWPHAGTVELAFIDGAHTYDYVRNDTEKAAVMMAERGLVFWHDYAGKGRFRGITDYLHELRTRFPVYRISGTTLAWTTAANLRTLVSEHATEATTAARTSPAGAPIA
jgi:predicted O-methyltransferase YrrM